MKPRNWYRIEPSSPWNNLREPPPSYVPGRMFRIFSRKHLERVKHVWGAGRVWGGSDIQHWLQHPLVQERINLKVSGTPGVNRFEYFLNHYLKNQMPVG